MIAAATVLVGLTVALGLAPSAAPRASAGERPVAVSAAQAEPSATAASHRRRAPRTRRHRGIGDASCSGEPVDRPTIELSGFRVDFPRNSVQLGVPLDFCFMGFTTAPIDVVVTLPNAAQKRRRIRPNPNFIVTTWYYLAYPPDPLGTYHMTATQGARTATVSFEVQPPPSRPSFETLKFGLPAGRMMPFVLAGFAPRERVAVYFYRQVGYDRRTHRAIYARGRRAATTVRTNQHGFARGQARVRRGGFHFMSAGGVFASFPFRAW